MPGIQQNRLKSTGEALYTPKIQLLGRAPVGPRYYRKSKLILYSGNQHLATNSGEKRG